jgi:hypothetical protein
VRPTTAQILLFQAFHAGGSVFSMVDEINVTYSVENICQYIYCAENIR